METPELPVARERGRILHQRRWSRWLLLVVFAVGVIWGGRRWWEVRRYRRAIAEIQQEIQDGRHGTAARQLSDLLSWKPDSDEAAYLLGVCEKARRRPQAASAAWARVPPTSRFARQAIRGRLDLEIENGRLAGAERLINELLADPRTDELGLLELVVPIYRIEGRLEEVVRLIEAAWDQLSARGAGASAAAITLARVHIGLAGSSTPVEAIRSFLDRAARLAPEDDRIWLGKANLALRVGSFDEAARWLEACLPRRPHDIPVWRARANWAMATGRIAEAREALAHLPAEASTPAEIHRVTAWLITHRKDVAMKRRDLERMIADDPTDFTSFDRLAELEVQEGHPARATELRREKARIGGLLARYQKLYQRSQPNRDAVEMAHLAEQLGRWFEAKVFLNWAIGMSQEPDDLRNDLDRVSRRARTGKRAGRTLAAMFAEELAP